MTLCLTILYLALLFALLIYLNINLLHCHFLALFVNEALQPHQSTSLLNSFRYIATSFLSVSF
jgi:hypothetical protein